ncbi:MAG TPA: hypothetical protein VMZ28_05600 [Kofleriaceae bacterium]|nr:hypothetical protein [Kofleriaceae bacterium]
MIGLCGCGDNLGGGGDEDGDDTPLPPGASGWAIEVDMSGLDRFAPRDAETWPVGGHVRSSEALAEVEVAGEVTPWEGAPYGGDFESIVGIAPGLTVVPIYARDVLEHERRAHRSIIASDYLPEGAWNDRIMTLALSDTLLESVNALIAEQTAGLDDQIAAFEGQEMSGGSCTMTVTEASAGDLLVELLAGEELTVHANLPDLHVEFAGVCFDGLVPVNVAGTIGGTIDITVGLTAATPAEGEVCVSSFTHSEPVVAIEDWEYEVYSPDGPVQTLLVQTLAPSSEDAHDMAVDGIRDGIDGALDGQLEGLDVLRFTNTIEVVPDRPITMDVCLAEMAPVDGRQVVRLAGAVAGLGEREAPGAPMLPPDAPVTGDGEFLLDTGLMSQMTFSMWRDGVFDVEQEGAFEVGLLALLIRELTEAFPDAELADIAVAGELPFLVRAAPDVEGADLRVEVGDLMVRISIEGQEVLHIGLHVRMDVDFVAQDGQMVPTVVGSLIEATVLGEMFDSNDDSIEGVIELGIEQAMDQFLGGGGVGGLPEVIPGLGRILDVTPDAGGRYLRVAFEPL